MVVFVVVGPAFGTKTALVAFFASQSKWFLKCLLWEKMRLIMGETTAMVLSKKKKTMTSYDLRQSRLVSLSRSLSFPVVSFFRSQQGKIKLSPSRRKKTKKKAPPRVHIIIVLGILSRIHIQKKIERERPPPLPPRDDDTKKAYRALLSKERKRKREKQRRG